MSVEGSVPQDGISRSASRRAVFLSYAREDAEPVRRIADALRAFGVEVWFDMNELRGGDAWDAKIRSQIRTCTLCVPVISASTQSRGEGYFRREWKIAVERTHDMASGVPFLLPVVIDDTSESEALVPEEFMRVQWTRLPMGVPTPEFVEQVRRLLEAPRKPVLKSEYPKPPTFPPGLKSGTAPGTAAAAPEAATPPKKGGLPGWAWGALAVVVLGVVAAVFIARKPAGSPDPRPQTPDPKSTTPEPRAQTPDPVTPSRMTDKSIAVIPFTNMSEDKDNAFFADGIHEDILTNLALIRELRVVSRTSVMSYRGTTKPMKQIAQELGVTYILEGSVRRAGNKVRVTGQLIHAATDEHVWAQSFDRELTDVFAIQAELSQQIAGALKAALSPEEKALIARKPTENPAAYDLFLRARDIYNRSGNTMASRLQHMELLQKAVDLDPAFAQAWGELAATRAFWYFSNFPNMEAQLAPAKAAIERAVQLAPEDPEVIGSLGTYYYYAFRDYDRAAEQFEKRAKLQPNSAVVFSSLGLILRRQGRWAQSLVYLRRACELDPANLGYLRMLIETLRAGRHWDEALAARRRVVALLPDDLEEAFQLALLPFQATGSTQEGEAFFAGLTPAQRDSALGIELRKGWANATGNNAEAVRLDKLQPHYDGDGQPHYEQAVWAALGYKAIGDREGARNRLAGHPEEIRSRLKAEPNNRRLWGLLGLAEAVLDRKEEALRCAARPLELLPESRDALDGPLMAAFRAYTHDLAGDKEMALAEYARLFRIPMTNFLNVHEFKRGYSNLNDDPRYQAILNDPANNAPLF